MLEYPESHILASQINSALKNRKIVRVIANSSPHKFAWFNGSSSQYPALLKDRTIKSATAFGGMVEIDFDGIYLVIGDGTNLSWHSNSKNIPIKHQLLLELDDHSTITCSVQMYGGIWAFKEGAFNNPYYLGSKKAIPLDASDFTLEYFLEKTQQFGSLSQSLSRHRATLCRIGKRCFARHSF